MKPANDASIDYKDVVRRGYDLCAADYDIARQTGAPPELSLLTARLACGASALDIGCGAGVPITQSLARRFSVSGVDISRKMLRLAQASVPTGKFIHGDIMSVEFPPASFSAAVAYYALFHLPRKEHLELFRRIYGWLKPDGYLLTTLTTSSQEGYTEEDFFGVTMYWSHYGLEDYQEMLTRSGFRVLEKATAGSGYTNAHSAQNERHPLVLAQKES